MPMGLFTVKDDLEDCTCEVGSECLWEEKTQAARWPVANEWCICGEKTCRFCIDGGLTAWWTSIDMSEGGNRNYLMHIHGLTGVDL